MLEGSEPPKIENAPKHNRHDPSIDPANIKELRRVFGLAMDLMKSIIRLNGSKSIFTSSFHPMRLVVEVIGHVVVRAAADKANEYVNALREETPGAQEEDEHQDVEGS